ncbi:MAG5150 family histidine triad lipoprotein [Mycoplasmopsis primatum]|uniref:MAG5150 family histidine triad lipoprotein n=1 Tax=Mycoplasmopsis primatum TaxID=55604 RepID=UPI000689E607|nr:hypothetical protein [Mycoplasmopsis primatum]
MKNKLIKIAFTATPISIIMPLISSQCQNNSQKSENDITQLIDQYAKHINAIENNFFAKKEGSQFHSENNETKTFYNETIFENLINYFYNNNENVQKPINLMKSFYEKAISNDELKKIIDKSFFDFSNESITYKTFMAINSIIVDLIAQIDNNNTKILDEFNNQNSIYNSKLIYHANPMIKQNDQQFTSKEWAQWISEDYKVLYSSLITYKNSTLIDPDKFNANLLKVYDSNTGASSNHNHSHSTFSMLWETLNYLSFFNKLKNITLDKISINYADSKEKIINFLTENKLNNLLNEFNQLVLKTDELFKITELNKLKPLYDKASKAKEALEQSKQMLMKIADAVKLEDDKKNQCFPKE